MENLTRRRALALLPAAGAAVAVPSLVAAAPQEDAGSKVVRLANELSEALKGFCDGQFLAEVWPSNAAPDNTARPVHLVDIVARHTMRAGVRPDLMAAITAHRQAHEELGLACPDTDAVELGRKPTRAAWRRWSRASTAERAALLTLCAFPCINNVEARVKAEYLLAFEERNDLYEEHIHALLTSAL